MKRKFGNLLMAATLVLAVGAFFTSCKDHDEELIAVIDSQNQTLEEVNDQLTADKEALEDAINNAVEKAAFNLDSLAQVVDSLVNLPHSDYATKAELEHAKDSLAKVKADTAELNAVKRALEALQGEYDTHVGLFNALSDSVNLVVLPRLTTLEGNYAQLAQTVSNLDTKYGNLINEVKGDLADVRKKAEATDALAKRAYALAQEDSVELEEVRAELVEVRAEAAANLAKAKEYTDSVNAALEERTIETINEFKEEYLNTVAELQDQIDVLQEEVAELAYVVEELAAEVEDIKEYLDKQITSVVVNGAYSPVVGYFSLPTGVKSNILAAYYGEKVGKFTFAGTNYNEDVLTGSNGNAGKLYLTFNPAEVSVTADQLKLVNSLGEESPVKITDLKVSTDKLVFGYTRSGAVLYEAEATIAAEDVEDAKLRIELSDLQDALKDVVTVQDGVNVTNLVTTLYTLVNDIADANAVQATWTDAEGVDHTVYSDFGLAAVAVKPLNYDFTLPFNSVPGYQNVVNLVNRVFDRVGTINIPDLGLGELNLDGVDFSGIKLGGLFGDFIEFDIDLTGLSIPYTLDVWVDVPLGSTSITVPSRDVTFDLSNGGTATGKVPSQTVAVNGKELVDGKIHVYKVLDIPVNLLDVPVKVETTKVLGDLGQSLEDMDAALANLDTFLKQVNDMLADINGVVESVEGNLNAALNKVQSGLNSYLTKINNKLCSMINSFNAALQPTMLVATTDGFSMLSSIKGAPTAIDAASAVLVPTSFTAEILAPAFLKHVAVTGAYDADGNSDAAAVDAANTGDDLNTVLPGETRTVAFNGKAGYTYEITYSACDYKGNTVETKYYVRVK